MAAVRTGVPGSDAGVSTRDPVADVFTSGSARGDFRASANSPARSWPAQNGSMAAISRPGVGSASRGP